MASIFYHIYNWGQKNKFAFWFCILLIVLLGGFGAYNIKFEEDITRILPQNEKATVTSKVLEQTRFSDKIAVIIEKDSTGSTDDMVELATQFLDSLATQQQYVQSVQGKVDDENITEAINFVYSNLPLFLDQNDYDAIAQRLNSDSIKATVEGNYKTLISPTGMVAKQFIQKDPMGIGFMALKKLQSLNIGDDFHLVDGFIMDKEEHKLLLFIDPTYSGTETEHNTYFVHYLNTLRGELQVTYQNRAQLDYFGASFVAVANAEQIKTDIQRTVVISITILMLLLVAFYKKLVIPIILFIPTILSALLALLVLFFIKDSISAISLSVGAILIGITIDYALHIMTHYKHCGNIKELYAEITRPIIMSCATTAIAFLCLVFVHSEALNDLGVFASITVMMAGILSLLIIPHVYKPLEKEINTNSNTILDKVARFHFDKNKPLFVLCLLAIVVSFFTFSKVSFDRDLASLNYFPEELQAAEQKLSNTMDKDSKSLYVISYGDNVDEVVENNALLSQQLQKAQKEGEVIQYSSLGNLVLSKRQQLEKINHWNTFWTTHDKFALKKEMIANGAIVDFDATTYQQFYDLLDTPFYAIEIEDYLQLNPQIMNEFFVEKEGFVTMNTLVKIKDEKRVEFGATFSDSNHYVVIDRKEMNEAYLGNLVTDFNSLINYSLLAVVCILWFFFRRVELVIVSMIPVLTTGLITTGMMGLFQIEFNIFSSIVCTLIFGQGVDFTIFMTNALQKEYTTGKNDSEVYRSSIILAVLTTLLAIGTLIFAKHPALKSISIVSLLGLSVSAIVAFVLYPRLFRFCFTNRQLKGKSPITLRLVLFNIVSYAYFGISGIVYSLIARIMMLILPLNKVTKLRLFGKGMSAYMTSVLSLNPFVKKKVIFKNKEDFKKPAIIIANHTSFLDSLTLGMVSSNIVFLVNDWVYKSPVFGKAIQMAGFYPVSQGVENSVSHLEERVAQGFSLMVFPEGTRSLTNDVQRFHKGAFYLAETLQLDIIPVYIHGNSEVNSKRDPIIYGGHIIATVGERISINDTSFGNNYSDRTKKISKFYKVEFAKIRAELEDENYFKQKLFLSYLYKEGAILEIIKQDFKLYKQDYYELNKHLAPKEKIMHLSADYGQINFLLAMQESKRKVVCYNEDVYARDVAESNYITKIRTIRYVKSIETIELGFTTILVSTDFEGVIDYTSINKVVVLNKKAKDFVPSNAFILHFKNAFVSVYLRK